MDNPFFINKGPFKISEIFKSLNLQSINYNLDKDVLNIKDLVNANDTEITFFHSKKYSEVAKKTMITLRIIAPSAP